MGRITVFSLPWCRHCLQAKALLRRRGWAFTDINVAEYPEKRQDLLVLTGRLSLPQIFFNERHIGGAADLLRLTDAELVALYTALVAGTEEPSEPRLTKPSYKAPRPLLRPQSVQIRVGDALVALVEVVDTIRRSVAMQTPHRLLPLLRRCSYRRYFVASDLVDLLIRKYGVKTRPEAVLVGQVLQDKGVFHHVLGEAPFADSSALFVSLQTDAGPPGLLNRMWLWDDAVDDAIHTLERCKTRLAAIVSQHTDADGLVDYVAVAADDDFLPFDEAVCELQKVKLEEMCRDTRLAFCLNLYNMMVLHGFAKVGVPTSNLQRNAFFSSVSYDVGGYVLSLNDVENGVLRGNRVAPYHLSKQFAQGDARLSLVLAEPEPRIHFALNCGARSCPPVETFTPEAVQQQLRMVAMAVLEQEENCRVDPQQNTLWLTQIFKWYRQDFGDTDEAVGRTVLQWLRGDANAALEKLLQHRHFRIRYLHYDWTTNAKRSSVFAPATGCTVL